MRRLFCEAALRFLLSIVALGCATSNDPVGLRADDASLDSNARDGSGHGETSSDADVEQDGWIETFDAGQEPAEDGSVRQPDGSIPVGPADASVPPEPTAPVERDLRVLQWNIAGAKLHDCRTGQITPAVRDLVRERDIDVVSLNEICSAQFDAIEKALRNLWNKNAQAKFAAKALGGKVGNAIFSKRNLDQVYRQTIGSDGSGDRLLICGRVAALPHLQLCSTHYSPAADKARAQLGRAHKRIESWWSERKDTVVLAGDFNIEPDDRALNAVYSQAANAKYNGNNSGAYREVDDADPEHCIGYGEGTGQYPNIGPCGQGRKIDYVLVRQNRIVGAHGANVRAIPGGCGGPCSDHRPVVGRIRVRIERP